MIPNDAPMMIFGRLWRTSVRRRGRTATWAAPTTLNGTSTRRYRITRGCWSWLRSRATDPSRWGRTPGWATPPAACRSVKNHLKTFFFNWSTESHRGDHAVLCVNVTWTWLMMLFPVIAGPGEGPAVPPAPAGNCSGAAGPSGSGPSLLQPG